MHLYLHQLRATVSKRVTGRMTSMDAKWTHPFARNSVVKGCAVELGGGRYSGSRSGESDGDDFEHFGCKYACMRNTGRESFYQEIEKRREVLTRLLYLKNTCGCGRVHFRPVLGLILPLTI